MILLRSGLRLYKSALDRAGQEALLGDLRAILREAPLFRPKMPRSGKEFSVRMSNCGALGWVSDVSGYRYQPCHPETGRPWPAMPERILGLWRDFAKCLIEPDACLINYYDETARMGPHQDRDEADFSVPILSLSLGDSCRFRDGGDNRRDPSATVRLDSGDILVFGGPARLMFHGVDRVSPGTSTLLEPPGRINLTLRRAV
ncbi:alpha-ketoglutarate-dependent dioxygenase AlkB [Rhodoblastus sp.]|uniref:alpha-ketoglutarate-dependent dioxygenase AlkB n=1 Tax=Rhodoblastus sp. TaxID=1962975 RepID=UPI00260FFA95|nr:alpha-ketoglutarate-dependent dioxygenase AlkB [Rhodoblastus sp.]